jgi:hypothetical protein
MPKRFKSTPFDKQVRTETDLLLAVKELTRDQVIELYEIEDVEYYKRLIAKWTSRAKFKHKKRTPLEQEHALTAARRQFIKRFGMNHLDCGPGVLRTITINDDPDFKSFVKSVPEVKDSTPIEDDSNTITNKNNTSMPDRPTNGTIASLSALEQMKNESTASVLYGFKQICEMSEGYFEKEILVINNALDKLRSVSQQNLELKDIKTLIDALARVIELRRKAMILPFGSIDPNKTQSINNSKHVHLHNHGLQSFNPSTPTTDDT